MAYTTINKSTDYFNTKLYTGNGSTNAITGVGFQPDWIWIKSRSDTSNHRIYDYIRGGTKTLYSNLTNDEGTNSDAITSFNSDGFTLGGNAQSNGNGLSLASWNWKANGQGSSNTDGSINTTYTSVNTTAGFSIVSYTGNGTSGATVGHGLGVKPSMFIVKGRNIAEQWEVYHTSLGATKNLSLDSTNAAATQSSRWNNTEPTTSVFSLGNSGATNNNGNTYIAYCFAEKKGYSKFGSYTGNGNADGTFVYTGFKPAFLIIKKTNAAKNWFLHDDKRLGYNPSNSYVNPNLSAAEYAGTDLDIVSNGFKMKSTGGGHNENGHTYIYMAFGQSLVGSNNVPCTAR
tara:strand:+ start:657 stop:1688 length:1032 start_codon:yes stop_codon:yes gene_type:complete